MQKRPRIFGYLYIYVTCVYISVYLTLCIMLHFCFAQCSAVLFILLHKDHNHYGNFLTLDQHLNNVPFGRWKFWFLFGGRSKSYLNFIPYHHESWKQRCAHSEISNICNTQKKCWIWTTICIWCGLFNSDRNFYDLCDVSIWLSYIILHLKAFLSSQIVKDMAIYNKQPTN